MCAAALAAVAVAASSPVLWLYLGWRAEQRVPSDPFYTVTVHSSRRIGPPWLARLLGHHAYWLDRADDLTVYVRDPQQPHSPTNPLRLAANYRWLHTLQCISGPGDTNDTGPADVVPLARLGSLIFIDNACTAATLRHLSPLTDLQDVSLGPVPAAAQDGLAFLSGDRRLTSLDLFGLEITDQGIAAMDLAHKPLLSSVKLQNIGVGDRGMQMITAALSLKELSVIGSPMTDDGLSGISRANGLTRLTLMWCQIDGHGLEQLRGLDHLQLLNLCGSPLDDAGLSHLPPLPSLTYVSLENTQVTDAGLLRLGDFPHLTGVGVDQKRVTRAGYEALRQRRPGVFPENYSLR